MLRPDHNYHLQHSFSNIALIKAIFYMWNYKNMYTYKMLLFFLCFLCVDQNLISQLLAAFIYLPCLLPCLPLFLSSTESHVQGAEPAKREMCAADSKAGGQNSLCPLDPKVQLLDTGLQDLLIAWLHFGLILLKTSLPMSPFFPSGMGNVRSVPLYAGRM